jgi:hypothetical protein
MDRAGQVQLRQEAGELAARVGLTGRLGEICSWHRWRRRVQRGCDEPPQELLGVTLAGRDGTAITFGRGYSDSALFLDRLDRMAALVTLPVALEQCRGGGDARFADLTLSRAGIGWDACGAPRSGPQFAAWPDIRSLALRRDRIEVGAVGWRLPRTAYLSGLPDSLVAVLLIQELARDYPAIRTRGKPAEAPPVLGPLPWTLPVNGTWP